MLLHILFVTPYYPPEITPPAIRIHEMAVQLVRLGHQVTILTTFPNFPTGIVPTKYRGHVHLQEQQEGVRIVRVWSYVSPNKGFVRRILAQLSFGCCAPLLGWSRIGRPDIVIVESPPLFDAIAGRLLAWSKRCPFIFTVADLWPEVAVQMGMLHNRVLIRLAEWLEWSTYRRAALIWVVTEGLRDILVQRGISPEHIFVLTNGVNCTMFSPLSQVQARSELDWDHRFTVLYAGGHGPSHGLATVLDTAALLHMHKDIHIILAGDGAEKDALRAEAQRRGLGNITFLDPQPHERIPLLLAASNTCLALARKAILFQGVLPVKMYEAMACARPVILAVDGEACRIAIQEAGAAIYAEPENPAAIAAAILHLKEKPEEAQLLGQRGRAFVEQRFDYKQLAQKLSERIVSLLRNTRGRGGTPRAPVSPAGGASAGHTGARQVPPLPTKSRAHAGPTGARQVPPLPTKSRFSFYYPYWCAAMNLAFSILGSVFLLVLFPMLALCVFLDSRGSIFYSQERLGYKGTPFRMYKFRTMHTGDANWAGMTVPQDPRITRVGRFLRATHLDELPQVINILRGEMSLIGPRPELPAASKALAEIIPNYRDRLAIKPGLTGWAQVMHDYGDTIEDERIKLEYDFYYMQNQSLWLDIQTLVKTVMEVLSAHGR